MLLYGGAYPEAICAANDYEQSVGRVFAAIRRIIECSPQLRDEAKITHRQDHDRRRSDHRDPKQLRECSRQQPRGRDIRRALGLQSANARAGLFDELVPPPTRQIACRLTVTYAGFEGESVLLEELYRRGLQQPQVAPNLHAGDGMLMFWSHEPVAPWQTDAWVGGDAPQSASEPIPPHD